MKIIISVLYSLSIIAMPACANNDKKRIDASEVNIRNYEQFVAQVKHDLPAGTSIQDVKKYLSDNEIKYGHATVEGCIKFMIKKIDSAFFVFKTDLQVKIFVSDESGVSEIRSELIETAF